MSRDSHILTINSGSSSIKFSLYVLGAGERLVLKGELGRIGVKQGFLKIIDHDGRELAHEDLALPDHDAALKTLYEWLQNHAIGQDLHAVGHRLVHGGPAHVKPQLACAALISDLKKLIPLAPEHLPDEIKALEGMHRNFPDLPQVACFDTAFHRRMPAVAQRYALPAGLARDGLQRYGFHGLSYEYIWRELVKQTGPKAAPGRVIVAHLGNGASMAAIEGGRSLDTTMGLTPAGGLVMSTRVGDVDPGVILFLLREKGMSPDQVSRLVNDQGGLLGASGVSSDMQDLLAREKSDPGAALAVDLFCYQAKKFIGALAAVLGGLDTLVFTGGIGENSGVIRGRLCANLEFLGIHLDRVANEQNRDVISSKSGTVAVRVMKTNEELMIALHARDILRSEAAGGTP